MALTKVSRGLLTTSIVDNGNATAITIDSSENIGLGLVPTNFANRTSLDIGLGGKIWGHAAATETGHGSNFYFDGAYKRIAAVAPTRHVQNGNGHTFSVAASGAADSTITWDDALIVSPSGSVGIGTTIFPQDFTVLGNYENAGFYRDYTGAGVAANYVNIGRKDTNGSLVSGVRISGGGDDAVAASHNGYFEIATRKAGSFVPLLSSYSGGSDLVVNEGGIDMDFRVESDNSTHALFVQGSSSNVGIGTSTITNPYSQTNFTDVNIDGTWGGVISFKLGGATKGWVGQRSSGNADMVVGATANEDLLLYANNAEKMRVVHEGLRIGGGANAWTNTQFEIAGSNGVDRHSRTITSGTNSRITGSSQSSIMAEGVVAVDTVSAGTILTIPHYSQPNLWRPFYVEMSFVTGEYNRATGQNGGWAKCGYAALTSLTGFYQFEVGGIVSSVSVSGMNLLVNFSTGGSGFTNGLSNYEGVCMHYKVMGITPDYFQAWNATLN